MTRLQRDAVLRALVRTERVLDFPIGPMGPENKHDLRNIIGDLRLALYAPACAEKEEA